MNDAPPFFQVRKDVNDGFNTREKLAAHDPGLAQVCVRVCMCIWLLCVHVCERESVCVCAHV